MTLSVCVVEWTPLDSHCLRKGKYSLRYDEDKINIFTRLAVLICPLDAQHFTNIAVNVHDIT